MVRSREEKKTELCAKSAGNSPCHSHDAAFQPPVGVLSDNGLWPLPWPAAVALLGCVGREGGRLESDGYLRLVVVDRGWCLGDGLHVVQRRWIIVANLIIDGSAERQAGGSEEDGKGLTHGCRACAWVLVRWDRVVMCRGDLGRTCLWKYAALSRILLFEGAKGCLKKSTDDLCVAEKCCDTFAQHLCDQGPPTMGMFNTRQNHAQRKILDRLHHIPHCITRLSTYFT